MSDSTQSKQYSKIAEALSKAQLEFTVPKKNRTVDFTDKNNRRIKYSYADLGDVIECVKKPLSANGLAISHGIEIHVGTKLHTSGTAEPSYGLRTTLLHTSGEYLDSWYPLPNPLSVRAQDFGSALTYARRYSLSSLLGIASEEDDDGAVANEIDPDKPKDKPKPKPQGNYKPPTEPPKPKSPMEALFSKMKEKGIENEDMPEIIYRCLGVQKTSKELTPEDIDLIISYIGFSSR